MGQLKTYYLFISSLRGGGAERVCVSLANGMAERKLNVKLIILNHKGVFVHDLLPEVGLISLGIKHARNSFFAILKMLRNEKPESILIFNHQIAIQLVLARFFLNSNVNLINRHISNLIEKQSNETSFWHKYIVHFIVQKLYRKVDLIVSQSEGALHELIHYYKIPENRIKIINNPVSETIRKASQQQQGKGKEKHFKVVMFIGRLVRIKGVDLLIKAFSGCIKRYDDLYLKIYGEGPERNKLKHQVQAEGLENNIHFMGFINDIANAYVEADLLVLTSKYEGFPNVLIEAITMGLPVVTFNCNYGPSEIIIEGINGYLVPLDNVEVLEQKILFALDKKWDSAKIKETSIRYSLSSTLDKYLEIL